MNADHRSAHIFGGKTLMNNLACACQKCNFAKGVAEDHQYIEAISENPLGKIAGRDEQYRYRKLQIHQISRTKQPRSI